MLKDSKKLLEIALNKYKETNNPEVTILYDECSEIINAGYVIPKILEELKENGLISEYSSLTIDFTMRLYLTRDGIEFFNNPQPDEYFEYLKSPISYFLIFLYCFHGYFVCLYYCFPCYSVHYNSDNNLSV